MSTAGPNEQVAEACRIATRLGLLDPAGFVAGRTEDGAWLAGGTHETRLRANPRLSAWCTPDDVMTVDALAELGDALATPVADAQVADRLAAASQAPAVALLSPEPLLQILAAGHHPRPVTHTNSELVAERFVVLPTDAYPWTDVPDLGDAGVVALGGFGVLVAGQTPLDCVRMGFALREIGSVDIAFRRAGLSPRLITPDEAANLAAERPYEKVPSRDPWRLLRGYDPLGGSGGAEAAKRVRREIHALDTATAEGTDRVLALACRTLAAEEDLVTYFEHVSMRYPSAADGAASETFAMSPASRYDRMRPDEILEVRLHEPVEGVRGPYPPAPYRWFHSDVLRGMPQVRAIVHTHARHGRSLGPDVDTLPRYGRAATVTGLDGSGVLDLPTLNFGPDIRAQALDLLQTYGIADIATHGTDFVGPDMETALGLAIARERMHRWTFELAGWAEHPGLSPDLARAVADAGPTPRAWGAHWLARRIVIEEGVA